MDAVNAMTESEAIKVAHEIFAIAQDLAEGDALASFAIDDPPTDATSTPSQRA